MARDRTLAVIRGHIESGAALQKFAENSTDVAAVLERAVLYPYLRFTARCVVPTISGRKTISVDCLIDGIHGQGATADVFASDDIIVSNETQLHATIREDDARRTAERTVTHRLGKELRMIAPFDVRLEARGTVYKRFWIVRAGTERIMMDSVTGHLHPLQTSAA